MNELTCITNQMRDQRACTVQDEHYTDCPSLNGGTTPCNGCLPRPARIGLVCGGCYNRIETALTAAGPWFQMLEGVDRAVQRDTENRGKPGSSVPIAPVPLSFDEIESYHRSFTGTAERWVADNAGAMDAIRFARAMHTALRNHPTAETPHQVKRTRCKQCEQLTLVWNPPQYLGGHVRVTCRDPECAWEVDQTSFETIAQIEQVRA